MRIFMNSINKAVNMMQQTGIDVIMSKKETEDTIEVFMKIPKAAVYKEKSKQVVNAVWYFRKGPPLQSGQ